ncbi:MAG: GNAT family N-acetyltransferase [Betaproteobacteria bacterium]|nr:GNAT family N-acetyltransferase [Betaproteobacteria bacterium]
MSFDLAAKARELTDTLKERSRVRKILRGPADLNYAIADSIAALDAGMWATATKDAGFFMSRDYLAAMEPVLPQNIEPHYALVFAGRGEAVEPIAAVYMQTAEIGLEQLRSADKAASSKTVMLGKVAGAITGVASQRILTCGNLLTYGQHGVAVADGADKSLVWHGVAEVLYRVREADKLRGKTHFIMIKDLHDSHTREAAQLTQLSYRKVETEPNMVLALAEGWKSYDDYLASLSSKYRANLRNGILKPIEEAGCKLVPLTNLASIEGEMFAQYQAVQMNATVRPFTLRPDYFAALERAAGERFRATAIMRDSRMLGFLITIAESDTALAYHIGFDRAAAADLPVYLRLLHAGIADSISLGAKRVSFGRTALEPKAALGAKPQPFTVLLRHRQPVLNKLIKRLLTGVEHAEPPERNPFKQVKAATDSAS